MTKNTIYHPLSLGIQTRWRYSRRNTRFCSPHNFFPSETSQTKKLLFDCLWIKSFFMLLTTIARICFTFDLRFSPKQTTEYPLGDVIIQFALIQILGLHGLFHSSIIQSGISTPRVLVPSQTATLQFSYCVFFCWGSARVCPKIPH